MYELTLIPVNLRVSFESFQRDGVKGIEIVGKKREKKYRMKKSVQILYYSTIVIPNYRVATVLLQLLYSEELICIYLNLQCETIGKLSIRWYSRIFCPFCSLYLLLILNNSLDSAIVSIKYRILIHLRDESIP